MTDPNQDPLVHRLNLVEEAGKREFGEKAWESAVAGLTKKMESGELSQADIVHKAARPTAATDLFYAGIAEASEEDWRRWRDSLPRRKERIRRTEG